MRIFQHQDLVGVEHGADPLGDDKTGSALPRLGQRLLEARFGLNIDGAGAVIQDQDRRLGQKRSSYRHSLPLPARESHPTLPHDGIVAVGEADNEVVRLSHFGRGDHLFFVAITPILTINIMKGMVTAIVLTALRL